MRGAMMRRRHLLLGGLTLLGGCGFHPVYAPGAGETDSAVARELAAVYVPVMPERSGQLFRQALQERLERFGFAAAKRYELSAPFAVGAEAEGIQPTSDITRVRYTARADWVLRNQTPAGVVEASGSARVMDGLNVIVGQFFALDLESEVVMKRLAENLADQVVAQMSSHFVAKVAAAKT